MCSSGVAGGRTGIIYEKPVLSALSSAVMNGEVRFKRGCCFARAFGGGPLTPVTRMLFQQGSDRYDTSDMLNFETGLPNMPSVYVTRDRRRVFVLTIGYKGVAVHEAEAAEIERLVQRLGLGRLRDMLATVNEPASERRST